MDPQNAQDAFRTLTNGGPWALACFLVLVNIGTSYALFKFFTGQLAAKDGIIRAFSDAMNRRTRAENARTEMEALQFAARPDLHPELKQQVNKVIQKLKDQAEEDGAILQR